MNDKEALKVIEYGLSRLPMNEEERSALSHLAEENERLRCERDEARVDRDILKAEVERLKDDLAKTTENDVERAAALKFIDRIDSYLRSGDGDWDITSHPDPEAESSLKFIRSLIEAKP